MLKKNEHDELKKAGCYVLPGGNATKCHTYVHEQIISLHWEGESKTEREREREREREKRKTERGREREGSDLEEQ